MNLYRAGERRAKDMPCVTVEQVLRLRDYAADVECQRDQLREALEHLMADISGGEKPCGHEFTCVCAGDKARAALNATKENPERS